MYFCVFECCCSFNCGHHILQLLHQFIFVALATFLVSLHQFSVATVSLLHIFNFFTQFHFNAVLQILNHAIMILTSMMQRSHQIMLLCFTLFSLQRLSHAISNRALVQCLVCLNRHFDLIANSYQQESTFSAIYSRLPDQFIERLRVQLFTNRANTCFTSLSFLEFLVQFILQYGDVKASSWAW